MTPSFVRRLVPLLLALAWVSISGCSRSHAGAGSSEAPDALTDEQELGRRLFEDARLSEPAGQSCASCHDASNAFSGKDHSAIGAVAVGSRPGVLGTRNAPSLLYAMRTPAFFFGPVAEATPNAPNRFSPVGGQFWDGRAVTLEAQAKKPFLEAREMNNASASAVIAKVRSADYAELFRRVYGRDALDDADAAFDHVAKAIGAFERSARFSPFTSRFDDHLRGTGTLTEQELRGFSLFTDPEKGNCVACHHGRIGSRRPRDWAFTDYGYDTPGTPRNPSVRYPEGDPYDLGLCDRTDLGRWLGPNTNVAAYCGAFRTPTLRNVAKTAPYMHNGVFLTLRDVVRFYATRSTNPELWYSKDASGRVVVFDDLPEPYKHNVNVDAPYDRTPGQTPRLDDAEIDAIVAFLETLTDR